MGTVSVIGKVRDNSQYSYGDLYTTTQPLFLPCTYMMNRFWRAGTIILMEEAQFHRKGHHSRALIRTKDGHAYLGLGVSKANRKPLNEVVLANPLDDIQKMIDTLAMNYAKTPGWKEVGDQFVSVLELVSHQKMLVGASFALMLWALEISDIEAPVMLSKDLVPQRPENASDWMAALGQAAGKKVYFAGQTSIDAYIKEEHFDSRGMSWQGQDYTMPRYGTRYGEESNGWISFIDPLFNLGVDSYRKMIRMNDNLPENLKFWV